MYSKNPTDNSSRGSRVALKPDGYIDLVKEETRDYQLQKRDSMRDGRDLQSCSYAQFSFKIIKAKFHVKYLHIYV